VEQVKLKRGASDVWAWAYRARLLRAPMPFWRVVVEAKLIAGARRWPRDAYSAVTAVLVWARTIEEAEALAVLALEREGLAALTADAKKCPPAAAPKRHAMAVARTELGFLSREPGVTRARRDARA
jgi:hypothetical protein